jgi:hypothetical protein
MSWHRTQNLPATFNVIPVARCGFASDVSGVKKKYAPTPNDAAAASSERSAIK